jgi:hypothetical protein
VEEQGGLVRRTGQPAVGKKEVKKPKDL